MIQIADNIPGTINIYSFETQDPQVYRSTTVCTGNLKTEGNVILHPQPSDSPNDPLNFSVWKKRWHFVLLSIITAFTAAIANCAESTHGSLGGKLGISYKTLDIGSAALFFGTGYSTWFLAPLSSLYGHRVTYILCISMGLIGSLWFSVSKKSTDIIWSQLFIGISGSCAEAHVQLSLSELFYCHQLGSVLTVYILATSIGTYLGPLIAHIISSNQSFRWVGWYSTIISFLLLILICFTMDETYFERYNNEEGKKENNQLKSYRERMKLITKASNIQNLGMNEYFQRLFNMLRVFWFPAVVVSGLVWGVQDAFLTFYLTSANIYMYKEPFNFSDMAVSLINIPCLIGATLGCIYAGSLSDYFAIFLAKKRNGIQEAEYRLYFIFLSAIISPIGLVMFGFGVTDNNLGCIYIGLGFIGFGFGSLGDITMSYLMDSYPAMVLEGMVGVSVINNTIGCISTFVCSPMLEKMGNQKVYIILAIIDIIITILAASMIIYGKRCRNWTKEWYYKYLMIREMNGKSMS
ncbi:hypothetical protein PACTADRAFT_34367 [Pachysolen tannophilus NRRL Y-2460]|uniref:Major facilitator superfamily (MFS) profile domain-containing protein n=1 Tax=Pachysolen tannophilus NRRL Y-2460 TaxID=669874 RepID=A0A1E4TSA1_PACTA|nr:hypothetical protein PACTADRAFT_34367 [Pachysolen tannophilus NRRL Y-2460]